MKQMFLMRGSNNKNNRRKTGQFSKILHCDCERQCDCNSSWINLFSYIQAEYSNQQDTDTRVVIFFICTSEETRYHYFSSSKEPKNLWGSGPYHIKRIYIPRWRQLWTKLSRKKKIRKVWMIRKCLKIIYPVFF